MTEDGEVHSGLGFWRGGTGEAPLNSLTLVDSLTRFGHAGRHLKKASAKVTSTSALESGHSIVHRPIRSTHGLKVDMLAHRKQ